MEGTAYSQHTQHPNSRLEGQRERYAENREGGVSGCECHQEGGEGGGRQQPVAAVRAQCHVATLIEEQGYKVATGRAAQHQQHQQPGEGSVPRIPELATKLRSQAGYDSDRRRRQQRRVGEDEACHQEIGARADMGGSRQRSSPDTPHGAASSEGPGKDSERGAREDGTGGEGNHGDASAGRRGRLKSEMVFEQTGEEEGGLGAGGTGEPGGKGVGDGGSGSRTRPCQRCEPGSGSGNMRTHSSTPPPKLSPPKLFC